MSEYGKTTTPPKGGSKGGGAMPEKTAAWPGLPGKPQPRDRSLGVPKVKNCPVKQGL